MQGIQQIIIIIIQRPQKNYTHWYQAEVISPEAFDCEPAYNPSGILFGFKVLVIPDAKPSGFIRQITPVSPS
jgi:hypothetical protein